MASPLDIIKKEKQELRIPKTLELANNLFQAFIKNNNVVGLKLCLVLSGAKNKIHYDDELQATFEVDSLCKIMQVTRKELSMNMKKILKIHFTFVDAEGGRGMTVPIHTYNYKANNKHIVIGVSAPAKKLFTELGKGGYSFSKANANNLMGLKHKHSIRMQLLLEQINDFSDDVAKRRRFTLEELNGYFGVNYSNYYEFERKILKPVKEEIDSSSTLTFIYEFKDEASGTGRPKIKEVVIDLVEQKKVQGSLF
jgi:plasmid replication initiation protein